MTLQDPVWLIGPWLMAWLTTVALDRFAGLAPAPGTRHTGVDGLRGHLALAVFIHHGVIWYDYLRSGHWEAPSSRLFNQLGQASVVLFFMITAFLFVGKLLDSRHKPIDWTRLFVSRVLRLFPLYLLALLGVLTLCGILSRWRLSTDVDELLQPLMHWLFFTIGGAPDLNGVRDTRLLIAGVTWSLPLEWMFYLLLPTLALLMRRSAPWWLAAATLLLSCAIWPHHRDPWMLRAFACGGMAAWLSRSDALRRVAAHPLSSIFVVLALCVALLSSHYVRGTRPMLALALAFTLIASGNSLFGVLVSRASRSLGELAYGIYLLHGVLLSGTLLLLVGPGVAARFTVTEHWLCLMALTPATIILAWTAFRFVEHPAMAMTDRCTDRLKSLFSRQTRT